MTLFVVPAHQESIPRNRFLGSLTFTNSGSDGRGRGGVMAVPNSSDKEQMRGASPHTLFHRIRKYTTDLKKYKFDRSASHNKHRTFMWVCK